MWGRRNYRTERREIEIYPTTLSSGRSNIGPYPTSLLSGQLNPMTYSTSVQRRPSNVTTYPTCLLSGQSGPYPSVHTGIETDHSAASLMKSPSVCPYCQKMFGAKTDLKRHIMIHTGQKPFNCKLCGKPFRLAQHLKTHKVLVHMVVN